jgi:rhamnogalacturonan endolyase
MAYRVTGFLLMGLLVTQPLTAQRQMEFLDRGLVALRQNETHVFVSWRLLGTDPKEIAFNLYRADGKGEAIKLNPQPLAEATCFLDEGASKDQAHQYFVRAVLDRREDTASQSVSVPTGEDAKPYLSVPLKTLEGYLPNDASVGDLDGDGQYEIVIHQVGRGRDNSQAGFTTEPILEAYKLDGTMLWRINLGKNIREGAHYTQFMV